MNEPAMAFEMLLDEICEYIASFLDTKSLCFFASTNKRNLYNSLIALRKHYYNLRTQVSICTGWNYCICYVPNALYSSGFNAKGRLGLGAQSLNQYDWTQLNPPPSTPLQIVAGVDHTLVLTNMGLYGYGSNRSRQLGLGAQSLNQYDWTQLNPPLGTPLQIVAGADHTLVLTNMGLYGRGSNGFGQLGNSLAGYYYSWTRLTPPGSPLQVAAGSHHTLVLTDRGLYACGEIIEGERDNRWELLSGRKDWARAINLPGAPLQIVSYGFQNVVVTDRGLCSFGREKDGDWGLSKNLSGTLLQIVAGVLHTIVLTDQGLYVRGDNSFGQLGLGEGQTTGCLNWRQVKDLPGIPLEVFAGGNYTFLWTSRGLYACGDNRCGQLGLGHANFSPDRFTLAEKNLPAEIKREFTVLRQLTSLMEIGGYSASDIKNSDPSGVVRLFVAASKGHADVMRLLLDKGADPNQALPSGRNQGWTPLFAAAFLGHAGIVQLLLDRGADPNQALPSGKAQGDTPLCVAASEGHAGVVQLLLDRGVDPTQALLSGQYQGDTPLFAAASEGHAGVVQLLLDRGVDPNQALLSGEGQGWTPLCVAASGGHADVVRLLLDRGVDPNQALPSGQFQGWTPLHVALDKALSHRDKPLELAEYIKYKEIISLLVKFGANREVVDQLEPNKIVGFDAFAMVENFPDLESLLANDLERLLKSILNCEDLILKVLSGFAKSNRRIIVPDASREQVTFISISEMLIKEIEVCCSLFDEAIEEKKPYRKIYYDQLLKLVSPSTNVSPSFEQSRQVSEDEVQLLFNLIQDLWTLNNKQPYEKNTASASVPSFRFLQLKLETERNESGASGSSMRCHTLHRFFSLKRPVTIMEGELEESEPPAKRARTTITTTARTYA